MASVLEIPGYYYDHEKRKYFKVQPSSAAPASSAYSSRDVKRRKIKDKREAAAELEERRQKDRIKTLISKVAKVPLAGGLLEREQGHSNELDSAQIFANGLVHQGGVTTPPDSPYNGGIFALHHRPDLGEGIVDVRFAWDNIFFTLRANTDKYNRSTIPGTVEMWHDSDIQLRRDIRTDSEIFPGGGGPSTSLTMNEAHNWIAMTWMAPSHASGMAILPMGGPSINIASHNRTPIILGPGLSRGPVIDVLSSAAPPSGSSLLFAFGTKQGLLAMDKERFDTHFISPWPIVNVNQPKDTFALEFLSDNHSILLSGGRRGILNITDLRIPVFGPDADIIIHPSSITHIKQIDSHRLIVAGLNSHLCQYDLRFRKTGATPSPRRKKKTAALENPNPTASILQYPDYFNNATIQAGFDIDVESGIVAAAQECGNHGNGSVVELFSLHGGHTLTNRTSWSLDREEPVVKCVRFARDSTSNMKSFYGIVSDLHRYAWVPGNEEY